MQPDSKTLTPEQQAMQPVKVGQVFVDQTRTIKKSVFFCRGGGTQYYFRNGACGIFVVGLVPGYPDAAFVTDVTGYIKELDEQIAQQHPNFYVVESIRTVDEEQLDPMNAVKKAAVDAYKAQLLKEAASEEAKKLLNSMGVGTPEPSFTEAKPVLSGIANSMTVASAMAGSDGSATVQPAAANPLSFMKTK